MANNICPLPWMSIETSPIGTARPCCLARESIKDQTGTDMQISKHGIIEMFDSLYMQQIRQTMLAGGKPETCKLCWDEESVGRKSKRLSSIEKFKFTPDINTKPSLSFIDLKLGNQCNLKCRMCGSWSSSSWAEEEIAIDGDNSRAAVWLAQGQWPNESEKFWDDLEQVMPHILYMEITGGEPLMIKNHYRFLKQAVESGHSKHISIHYNTNGTLLPKQAMRDLWPHFKSVEMAFSIDDLNERFEYQRHPAKWDLVNHNMEQFWEHSKQHRNFTTQICCTVNMFNITNIQNVAYWIQSKPFDYVYLNLLHSDPVWSIKNLPDSVKQLVMSRIDLIKLSGDIRSQLVPILDFMHQPAEIELFTERKERIIKHDDYRKENFIAVFPELSELLC